MMRNEKWMVTCIVFQSKNGHDRYAHLQMCVLIVLLPGILILDCSNDAHRKFDSDISFF